MSELIGVMSLIGKIFNRANSQVLEPDIRFGRYSDAHKSPEQLDAWTKSLDAFDAKDYFNAYQFFFKYLFDEEEDNIRWKSDKGGWYYEFYQGSKKIIGSADSKKVTVMARIVKASSFSVGLLRRLLEKNFHLKFSRFAITEDNDLSIVFDSYSVNTSPYKLYSALKELALQADKFDDLLLDEFSSLEQIDQMHIVAFSDEQKEVRYQFLKNSLDAIFAFFKEGQPDPVKYPAGMGFYILSQVYKLDFLLKPEGFMMESFERLHRNYFAQNNKNQIEKNKDAIDALKELMKRDKQEYFKEMYRVKSTFGITNAIAHDQLIAQIDSQINQLDWFAQNDYPDVAIAVADYIIGNALFNYAVPEPDKALFQVYFHVTEWELFQKMGFSAQVYDAEKGILKRGVKSLIERVENKYKARFPHFRPKSSSIDMSSKVAFARSFLMMVRELNLREVETKD